MNQSVCRNYERLREVTSGPIAAFVELLGSEPYFLFLGQVTGLKLHPDITYCDQEYQSDDNQQSDDEPLSGVLQVSVSCW